MGRLFSNWEATYWVDLPMSFDELPKLSPPIELNMFSLSLIVFVWFG